MLLQLCLTLCDPVDCSPLLSIGFSRQEYWNGLLCPSPGDLSNSGIEPTSLISPALAGRFFTTSATWETLLTCGVCTNSEQLVLEWIKLQGAPLVSAEDWRIFCWGNPQAYPLVLRSVLLLWVKTRQYEMPRPFLETLWSRQTLQGPSQLSLSLTASSFSNNHVFPASIFVPVVPTHACPVNFCSIFKWKPLAFFLIL